mmetsp:Transcript_10498/g.32093  ORF Transcript_10498/g.32093 Transcript_10498/m.32093 type:complete len:180 (+) Transcript_10498:56-595(+)
MASLVRSGLLRGSLRAAAYRQSEAVARGMRLGGAGLVQQRRWLSKKADDKSAAAGKTQKKAVELKVPEPQVLFPEDQVPDLREYATGVERLEMEIGLDRLHGPSEGLIGAFGTKEAPYQVESAYDQRLVGCTGYRYPDDHEVLWLKVKKGETAVCPYCEQHFQLTDMTLGVESVEKVES